MKALDHPTISLKESTEPLLFIHLAKTGGSSIWHTLIKTADLMTPPLPIVDLYQHGRCDYGTVADAYRVLEQFKDVIGHNRVLIHHHTSQPIGAFFKRDPIYTTIVRDPVDRFISDLNHSRAVLQGEWDEMHQSNLIDPKTEMEGRGWPRHLIEMAASTEVGFEELLKNALTEPCLARYYYWTFYNLLLGEAGVFASRPLPSRGPSDEDLSNLVHSKFAYIGRFPHVFKSYIKIAQIYKMGVLISGQRFPHLLQRNSDTLIPHLRKNLRAAFRSEYEFLFELGFDFS